MKNILKTILIALLPFSASAADLNNVQGAASADLKKALAEFADLQNTIKEEKIPLSKALNDLKAELREKRREAESAQRFKDSHHHRWVGH